MNSAHKIFEDHYLTVRRKEHRVYTDTQVKQLPFVSPLVNQKAEWKLREKTTNRFLTYLKERDFKQVLDLACGNGWFTQLVANELPNATVLGGDINHKELEQAKRCFPIANLSFEFIDVFQYSPEHKFDLIVINAAIQYFPDVNVLMEKISRLLTVSGEFHILDSPIYKDSADASLAKQRTLGYYQKMEVPEMAASYHHHIWKDFGSFTTMYQPQTNKLISKLRKDSPFPWLVYRLNE